LIITDRLEGVWVRSIVQGNFVPKITVLQLFHFIFFYRNNTNNVNMQ